jgi:hypothetical protein
MGSWEALAQRKVFFGHKSVGVNIIQGIADILGRRPSVNLNIRETSDPAAFAGPVFAHALIGTNKDPASKIQRFGEVLADGIGGTADAAFFKFCFVDIDHTTDVEALFRDYSAALDGWKAAYPSLDLITVTVPLTSRPVGLKARLKKILGRLPWEEADNVQRNIYNGMLREKYADSLFDLAAIESRIDDTRRATFTKDGGTYDLLHRPYTSDGGHLNEAGRRIVAAELLAFLASRSDR